MKVSMFPSRPRLARLRSRRGQALAEAAIVLPLLLLLVFGIVELSNAWRTFQTVTNSAREGARVGVVPGSSVQSVHERIRATMESGSLEFVAANVTIECTDRNGATAAGMCSNTGEQLRVAVRVNYEYDVLRPLAGLLPITISNSTIMRRE
jgi:Flp pilus assembly protein TadG